MMNLLAVGACVRQLFLEIEFQGYRIVMLGVVGAVEQCHRTALGSLQNRLPSFRPGIEFGGIFALKLRPFLRIVRKTTSVTDR
jgi:hypothetical protein